jgi:citrate synthase
MSGVPRGLDGVVAVQTRLSHVDGANGILIIGGYELEALAGRVTFEAAAHLLWTGHLPSPSESVALSTEMAGLRPIPDAATAIVLEAAARRAPPIDALRMACSTLSNSICQLTEDRVTPIGTKRPGLPQIVAACWRPRVRLHRARTSLAANFPVWNGRAGTDCRPCARYVLVTVIDHGMNASTFTVVVASTIRMAPITGASRAEGPLHGGAGARARHARRSDPHAEAWVRQELAAGRRIMGFGQRIYKVRDPRAEVLSKVADEMAGAVLDDRTLFDLAREVEATVLRVLEEVKPGRHLRTNVEFYTALVVQSMGRPPSMFVAMFACGRCAGGAVAIEQHA